MFRHSEENASTNDAQENAYENAIVTNSKENLFDLVEPKRLNQIIPESVVHNCLENANENQTGNEEENEICQEEFEDLPERNYNRLEKFFVSAKDSVNDRFKNKYHVIGYIFNFILFVLYFTYFGWAIHCSKLKTESDVRLLWMTCSFMFLYLIYLIRKHTKIDNTCNRWFRPLCVFLTQRHPQIMNIFIIIVCLIFVLAILIVEVVLKNPSNLFSFLGIFAFLLFTYSTSYAPKWILWRPVISGIFLQFVLAYFILRTDPGLQIFTFLGTRIDEFLAHTNQGSKFVFGDDYQMHFFAFAILPVIIFFGSIVSLLFYLGWLQVLITKMGGFMQVVMGTTSAESFNAAANVFIGMTEAPILIKPYLGKMTNSEIHAVMTGGFATIAGSVLASYIRFGIPAVNLLTASVMNAPAALAISKLTYPETKKSKTRNDELKIDKQQYRNFVEAFSGGASDTIVLVANIAANLIAFQAMLSFVNGTLTWMGERACLEFNLTFEVICSYVLWPISWLMGCASEDCRKVSELIGVKVFLNEFIAYRRLGDIKNNRIIFENFNISRSNLTWNPNGDAIFYNGTHFQKLIGGLLSERSEFIAQYALCGFANFGSIGVMLGGLSAMSPKRRRDMATLVARSMMAGNIVCFITACIAGLFFEGSKV